MIYYKTEHSTAERRGTWILMVCLAQPSFSSSSCPHSIVSECCMPLHVFIQYLCKESWVSLQELSLYEQNYPAQGHSSSPVTACKKWLVTSGACGFSSFASIWDNSARPSQLQCPLGGLLRLRVQPHHPPTFTSAQFCFLNSLNLYTQSSTSESVPWGPQHTAALNVG